MSEARVNHCRFALATFCTLSALSMGSRAEDVVKCDPEIPEITIPESNLSVGTEATLFKIYVADQHDRDKLMRSGVSAWPAVARRDVEHRKIVLDLLRKQRVRSSNELYLAAFVFQHGQCPADYQLANRLAQGAIDRGSEKAKWLYAASLDRYLIFMHRPQKFGTQFRLDERGRQVLEPVDPSTTDEERAKFNVPPLSDASNVSAKQL
jgi:hypothetical protein